MTIMLHDYRDSVDKIRIETLVAALRSGEFDQTGGYLKSNDSYCCLGVACEIMPGVTWEDTEGVSTKIPVFNGKRDGHHYLPSFAREYYGLPNDDVSPSGGIGFIDNLHIIVDLKDSMAYGFDTPQGYIATDRITFAANANDTEGVTFEFIADAIERTYLDDEYYRDWLASYHQNHAPRP